MQLGSADELERPINELSSTTAGLVDQQRLDAALGIMVDMDVSVCHYLVPANDGDRLLAQLRLATYGSVVSA